MALSGISVTSWLILGFSRLGRALCCLTFELSCPRRQALQAWFAMMYQVPRTRLAAPAVAGQLERGVRPHSECYKFARG